MTRLTDRFTGALIGALLLGFVALLAGSLDAGPLDPDGPPASTMKSLDEIPGSWSRTLPANDGAAGPNPPAGCDSSRFDCLEEFFNDLVLDRETGLVWVRDAVADVASASWAQTRFGCVTTRYEGANGYRMGFRMPTVEELHTLVQHFVTPPLPPGHPFVVSTTNYYWTATSTSSTTASAYRFDGSTGTLVEEADKSNLYLQWCVRGGFGYDGT